MSVCLTRRIFAPLLLGLSTALAQNVDVPSPIVSSHLESFVGESDFTIVAPPGCNSVAFAQIPDLLDLFIGRELINTDPGNLCSGMYWKLVLYRLDWNTWRFRPIRTILAPRVRLADGALLYSSYDPAITLFRDRYWVAFECNGERIPHASICIGSFDPRSPGGEIDPAQSYVIVSGESYDRRDVYTYGAGVPKLLVFHDRLYLYWTALKVWKAPPADRWLEITARGAELEVRSDGHIWVKGARGPIAANDPISSDEVLAPDKTDRRSNQTADVFSLISDGETIYGIAGLGGDGCLRPLDKIEGCYRLKIFSAVNPLGPRAFDKGGEIPERLLPTNPQEYTRFFRKPDGSLFLLGRFLNSETSASNRTVPDGLVMIRLPKPPAALFSEK